MYGLDPTEESAIEEKARSRPFDPALDAAPSVLAGSGTATAKGLWGAFESANALFNDALAPIVEPFLRPIDAAFGTESATWFDREITQASHEALRRTRPDPAVTGAVGQVLYGVTAMLPQAAAGFMAGGPAGAAALVGAAQGNAARLNAIDEGVDPATAVGVGAIEGVADAAGVVLPGGIGSTVIKKLASGIGMNVVAGGAQRGATGAFLRANGYEAQAEQYRVLDGMALATDAILGAAFGAMPAESRPKISTERVETPVISATPSEVDAALAAHDIHNLELDSAPGIPVDLATRNAHVDAMELAMAQVLRGEPVNVAQALKASEFMERPPQADHAAAVKEALDESAVADIVRRQDGKRGVAARDDVSTLPEPQPLRQAVAAEQDAPDAAMPKPEAIAADAAERHIADATAIIEKAPAIEIAQTGEGDAVRTQTAKDAVAEADAAVTQAKADAKLFDVAINCFIGHGQ